MARPPHPPAGFRAARDAADTALNASAQMIAAPLGAWAAKHIPHKPFMILVGLLVVGLSTRNLLKFFAIL